MTPRPTVRLAHFLAVWTCAGGLFIVFILAFAVRAQTTPAAGADDPFAPATITRASQDRPDPFLPATSASDAGQTSPAAGSRDQARPGRDLTTRYLLAERYSPGDPEKPGIAVYEVAFKETVRISQNTQQGAPVGQEFVRTGRYAERPLVVASPDSRMVTSLMRRYDAAEVNPDPWARAGLLPLMENLTLWAKNLGGVDPEIVVLTPGRPFYDQEYHFVVGNPFLPNLALIVPEAPLRVGDVWSLPGQAATALLVEPITIGTLMARLSDVRADSDPSRAETDEVAQIDIEGRVNTRSGATAVRARVEFAFHDIGAGVAPSAPAAEPLQAAAPDRSDAPGASGRVVGLGGIAKIRLAQVTSTAAVPNVSLGGERRRELILERRWPPSGAPLLAPEAPPKPTQENSWLTYVDPSNSFSFQHPQGFSLASSTDPNGPESVVLSRVVGRDSEERVFLTYLPGESVRADTAFQAVLAKYRESGYDVTTGATAQPPADLVPNAEVRRLEAAMTLTPTRETTLPPAGSPTRLHFDGYVVLFTQNLSVVAMAVTGREDPLPFRSEVESILKTFRPGRR